VSAGACAIGGFVRSRWLLAADAGELWGLLGSLGIRGRDYLSGGGFRKWRSSINYEEWVDIACFGGGLKSLIGAGRRGRTHQGCTSENPYCVVRVECGFRKSQGSGS